MKTNTTYLLLLSFLAFAACKKEGPVFSPLASLFVSNAVVGGATVKLNSNVRDSAVLYNYKQFVINASAGTPIKVFASNDPGNPYMDQTQQISNGGIYSVFLMGTSNSPKIVFGKDEIAPFSTDSILRIRAINCSPGSPPLHLTRASAPDSPILEGLSYQTLSAFTEIPLPGTMPAEATIFQVRDAQNAVVASYTLPAAGPVSIASSRFKNITLVIKGLPGTSSGPDALGMYAMPNY